MRRTIAVAATLLTAGCTAEPPPEPTPSATVAVDYRVWSNGATPICVRRWTRPAPRRPAPSPRATSTGTRRRCSARIWATRGFFALATAWTAGNRNKSQDNAGLNHVREHRDRKDYTALINTWLDSPTTPR